MALLHTQFFSDSLGMCTSVDIIIPESRKKLIGIESEASATYKTLYLLHRLSDDFKPKGGQQFFSFPDVPHEFWAAIAIYDVNQKGWMTGYPDGNFRPDAYLTRAEFVTALQRATGVVFSTKTTGLTDIAGHWAEKYITTASYYGFVNGYPDMTFKPNNNITRAEIAIILERYIGNEIYNII